jgi:DNA (cytosine-5)-methyltransferase 1
LLDLFCGAGGAAMGYHRAGFDVVGVDIEPQPYYPFDFHQGDAMTWPLDGFDAVHASPPCQRYSTMGNRKRLPAPDLLESTIARLRPLAVPWVVENVTGASGLMPNAVVLAGAMFGLDVHRPRLFASNLLILTPPPMAPPAGAIGVYGRRHDGRRLRTRLGDGIAYRAAGSLEEAHRAMGMDWADWHGTKEAIPPAYTEYVGRYLIEAITAVQTHHARTLVSRGQGDPATAGRSQEQARPRHQGVLHPGMPAG